MKKLNLNKKGFTLVELLAVIVILAILLIVVGNTALPALTNAKKNSLKTYAQRVVEQAKALEIADPGKCVDDITTTNVVEGCDLSDIMGEDNEQYEADIRISGNITNGIVVNGKVTDKDGNIATISDNVVSLN